MNDIANRHTVNNTKEMPALKASYHKVRKLAASGRWQRTGYQVLTKVDGALSDIPRRPVYPQCELLTNPQPQQSAKLTDRLRWDAQ